MNKTSFITQAAIIAAIYAALTFINPFGYGVVQCRVSEALCVLPMLTPCAIPGLFAGCLIANIYTGSLVDIIFGSLTTLLAAFLTYKTRKTPWLAMFFPVILNAVIVGGYLCLLGLSEGMGLGLCMLSVGAGQAVACYVVGMPLYFLLRKTKINSLL